MSVSGMARDVVASTAPDVTIKTDNFSLLRIPSMKVGDDERLERESIASWEQNAPGASIRGALHMQVSYF